MIKNILIDMGGVIFRQNTAEACRRFQSIGLNTDVYMGEYGQKDFFLELESGLIDTDEFCRRLAAIVGRESISYDEAEYCWLGFIKDVPIKGLHDLLTLRKDYHLGLLSNTNPFIMGYTRSSRFSEEQLPITHYLDSFYCSYEMGVCKPNREIYEIALETGKMKPEETLFVDDSIKNIKAAEEVGIHGLHVNANEDWIALVINKLKQLNTLK